MAIQNEKAIERQSVRNYGSFEAEDAFRILLAELLDHRIGEHSLRERLGDCEGDLRHANEAIKGLTEQLNERRAQVVDLNETARRAKKLMGDVYAVLQTESPVKGRGRERRRVRTLAFNKNKLAIAALLKSADELRQHFKDTEIPF